MPTKNGSTFLEDGVGKEQCFEANCYILDHPSPNVDDLYIASVTDHNDVARCQCVLGQIVRVGSASNDKVAMEDVTKSSNKSLRESP